jgi:hypothetical protein
MGFDRLAEWGPFRFAASTDSFGVNVPGAVATSPAGSVAAGEDAIVPFVTLVNSFLPIFNGTCRLTASLKGAVPVAATSCPKPEKPTLIASLALFSWPPLSLIRTPLAEITANRTANGDQRVVPALTLRKSAPTVPCKLIFIMSCRLSASVNTTNLA